MLVEALQLLLTFALVYNNALVVLGPSAWGGLQPRRAFVVAVVFEVLGVFASPMAPLPFDSTQYLVALLFYAAFTAARTSLPISIFLYSLKGLTPLALLLWFGTPAVAFAVGYFMGRGLRPSLTFGYFVLAGIAFMFGANNIAFITKSPYVVVPIVVGNYLGLWFSRWIVKLYAFSTSGAVAANTSAALLAALGTGFKVPMSFTLLIYSTLLGSATSRKMRIIKISDFLKALTSILTALLLAYVTLLF
ncbi:MAG: hypothetical protein ABWJ97_01320, partial [Thermoproteus sp.]